MAHTLTPTQATAFLISANKLKKKNKVHKVWACQDNGNAASYDKIVDRRTLTLGVASAMVGLSIGDRSANAAGRRPPPPPPKEKQDPNVSGVMAKILASKKRKEAMKEAAAKQREKGKLIIKPIINE